MIVPIFLLIHVPAPTLISILRVKGGCGSAFILVISPVLLLDAVSVLITMLVLVLVLAHILTRSLRRIRIISFSLRLLIHGSCSFDGASFRDLCIAGYSVSSILNFNTTHSFSAPRHDSAPRFWRSGSLEVGTQLAKTLEL